MAVSVSSDPSARRAADSQMTDPEALDYDRFAQTQDALDIEAATWVARERGGLDAAGQAELDAWLAQDPRHQDAYDDMDDTLGRLHEMPAQAVQSLRSHLGAAQASQPETSHSGDTRSPPLPDAASKQANRPVGWRHWISGQLGRLPQLGMAALMMLLIGIGGFTWWWLHLPDFAQQFATAPGQTLQIALPDGSRVQLDTDTRLRVRLYSDRREMQLEEGQAYFDVEWDVSRPFLVDAGDIRVTVLGTRFIVRHTQSGLDAGETRVAVEEGHVKVNSTRAKADPSSIELLAGQLVVTQAQNGWAPVQRFAANELAPWQSGRINFMGTPLKQALAEFQRYGAPVVVIHDPFVAALPVGGSFKADNFAGFLEMLPLQLPVRLEQQDQTQVLVRRQ